MSEDQEAPTKSVGERIQSGDYHAMHKHEIRGKIVLDVDGAYMINEKGERREGMDLDFLDVHTVVQGKKQRLTPEEGAERIRGAGGVLD